MLRKHEQIRRIVVYTLFGKQNKKIKNKIEILKHTLKSVKLISSVLNINQLTVNLIIFFLNVFSECQKKNALFSSHASKVDEQ